MCRQLASLGEVISVSRVNILGMGLGHGYLLARVGDKRGKWFVGRLVNTFVFITFFHGLGSNTWSVLIIND